MKFSYAKTRTTCQTACTVNIFTHLIKLILSLSSQRNAKKSLLFPRFDAICPTRSESDQSRHPQNPTSSSISASGRWWWINGQDHRLPFLDRQRSWDCQKILEQVHKGGHFRSLYSFFHMPCLWKSLHRFLSALCCAGCPLS